MPNNDIQFGKWWNGLSALGKMQQDKFVTLDNCDIHSEVGLVMPQLAMTSESTTPNEACLNAIDPSGNIFFCSTASGKIWKRTTAGAYSLVATNSNGAHTGCRYFNGFLWYWTSTKLGYYQISGSVTLSIASPCVVTLASHGLVTGQAVTFSTTGALPTGITAGTTYYVRPDTSLTEVNEFWLYDTEAHATTGGSTGRIDTSGSQSGTHTMFVHSFATGTDFREGIEANNTLIIANGRYIARIDATNTFSANELTLPAQYKATCLKNIGDDVLIGTYVSTDVAYCRVFLWDTVSTSWTFEDEVFEIGINCFVQLDNIIVAQCGTSGRFYYWTGRQMSYFGKIRGITTALGEQKSVVYNGRPLFANATKIYSIHREDSALPFAFCGEYTCTGTIQSLAVQGQTLLASVGTGVDKKGTAYATAIIETPESQNKIADIRIGYDIYPEGVGIETKMNGGSYVAQTEIIDINEREVYFDGGLEYGVIAQAKITLTPSGSNIPKVKLIKFL